MEWEAAALQATAVQAERLVVIELTAERAAATAREVAVAAQAATTVVVALRAEAGIARRGQAARDFEANVDAGAQAARMDIGARAAHDPWIKEALEAQRMRERAERLEVERDFAAWDTWAWYGCGLGKCDLDDFELDGTLAHGALIGGAPPLPRTKAVVAVATLALLPPCRPSSRTPAPMEDGPCSPRLTMPSGPW
jgi:hypothetical protein